MEPYYGRPIPKYPCSAIVYKDGNKVIARDMDGKLIAKGKAGDDDASVIQSSLDSLTPGRTWKEKVVLIGDFIINNQLVVNNYTKMDLYSAKLVMSNNINKPIITTHVGSNNIDIFGGILDHNGLNQNDGQAVIHFRDVSIGTIKDVYVKNAWARGIEIDGGCKCTVQNCVVEKTYNSDIGNGIMLWSNDNTIKREHLVIGCKVYEAARSGIDLGTVAGVKIVDSWAINCELCGFINDGCGEDIEFISCTAVGNNIHGFELPAPGIIKGCISCYNKYHGIHVISNNCIIIGNKCYNNNQSNGSNHGIGIENAQNCIIIGNRCYDNQTTKTQQYGISEYGTSDYNLISNNDVSGNATGGIYKVGANTIIRNNIGYPTENHGTASITGDGSTTIFTIPHGLVSTPNYVNVIPKGNAPKPDSIDWDATNITLTFSTAPASGTYYYAWEARI